MVSLANISDKSIHPQEGSSFLPASPNKCDRNSAIIASTAKWFASSCSSRDSASSDISVYGYRYFSKWQSTCRRPK